MISYMLVKGGLRYIYREFAKANDADHPLLCTRYVRVDVFAVLDESLSDKSVSLGGVLVAHVEVNGNETAVFEMHEGLCSLCLLRSVLRQGIPMV